MTTTTDTIGIRPGRQTERAADVDFDALRVQLGHRLVLPGDPGWAETSLAWNLAVDQAPCAVVLAESADDVAAAVRFARAYGLSVAPQAGGHGASGRLAGSIVVRSSGLETIEIDLVARTARVGAGVRWGALQAALDGTDLTGMIGSNPDVSVVGYTLQGGYSWFTRPFGMGADSLRAAEIVDADGCARRVDDATDPELMWALRGGGGNVAYVTAVEIDLHHAPAIAGGRMLFPIADARSVLNAYAAATGAADAAISLWASLVHVPDVPFVPDEVRGQSFVVVESCTTDGLEGLERVLAPIRAAGIVVYDTVGERSASEVGDICEEPVDPMPAAHRGMALGEVTPETIEALLAVAGKPGGIMQVQLRHLGPARAGRRDGLMTGVPSEFIATALSLVPDPAIEPMVRDAFDEVAAALRPWTAGAVGSTLVAAWDTLERSASHADRTRLAEVMADEDPTGLFRAAVGLA
ncbi:FAD-binding oxidoreductase [Mumia sp. DW29H23]|uniref:FAD-binding oxidoreductase n=1 Tax=Mumia sp. DW29H23 TaxID=3421241 RepID=UPI003D69B6F7